MLDKVTVETFSPHVGETFHLLFDGDQTLPVTLIAADRARQAMASTGKRVPFSILFRPPAGRIYQQGIYRVAHDSIGTLEIFLVPVIPDAEGPRLEGVFS